MPGSKDIYIIFVENCSQRVAVIYLGWILRFLFEHYDRICITIDVCVCVCISLFLSLSLSLSLSVSLSLFLSLSLCILYIVYIWCIYCSPHIYIVYMRHLSEIGYLILASIFLYKIVSWETCGMAKEK